MQKNNGMLIFKEKQVKILLALSDSKQEWNLSKLAKASDTTYVHASTFINRCADKELVTFDKHGKIKSIFLTEKGKHITSAISSIMDTMESKEEEQTQASQQQSAQQ